MTMVWFILGSIWYAGYTITLIPFEKALIGVLFCTFGFLYSARLGRK